MRDYLAFVLGLYAVLLIVGIVVGVAALKAVGL